MEYFLNEIILNDELKDSDFHKIKDHKITKKIFKKYKNLNR